MGSISIINLEFFLNTYWIIIILIKACEEDKVGYKLYESADGVTDFENVGLKVEMIKVLNKIIEINNNP